MLSFILTARKRARRTFTTPVPAAPHASGMRFWILFAR